jgi:small subunit ribosomal protein S4
MGKYRGPKSKVARRFKEPIFGPDESVAKKPYPPGQHGPAKRRAKMSEYARQLSEKQKAKYTYGLLEKQFFNTFKKANRRQGITGENLLQYLESRLDNVVYRLGLAPTRAGARQLVNHRHIQVNQGVVDVPSYSLNPGDIVEVRERSKSLEVIEDAVNKAQNKKYDWLDFDVKSKSGRYLNHPTRDEIPENINETLIVELYSK